MGVCYYLWREDNRTAYELGKSYGWDEPLGQGYTGTGEPMTLKPEDAPTLAELLAAHLLEEGWWKAEDIKAADQNSPTGSYFGDVCADIARWSEGQPFVYVSENDGRIEDASMEAYDSKLGHERAWITGSRFRDTKLPTW